MRRRRRNTTTLRRFASVMDRSAFRMRGTSTHYTTPSQLAEDDETARREENLRSIKRRIVHLRRQPTAAPVHYHVGFRSRTGWEPLRGQKHNQDTVVAIGPLPGSDRFSLFAVLDGHGTGGHVVSMLVAQYVSDVLNDLLHRPDTPIPLGNGLAARTAIANCLTRAIRVADRRIMRPPPKGVECSMSGSTGVFVLLDGATLYCANVGDSRAVVGRHVPFAVLSEARQRKRFDKNTRDSDEDDPSLLGFFDGPSLSPKNVTSAEAHDSFSWSIKRVAFTASHYKPENHEVRGENTVLRRTSPLSGEEWSDVNASAYEIAQGGGQNNMTNNSVVFSRIVSETNRELDSERTRAEMRKYGAPNYVPVALSIDHDPKRPEEKARVVNAGGRVNAWETCDVGEERVWLPDKRVPGLAVTRAFGDSMLKTYGVTCEPEIYALQLSPRDKFFVLATDGVFDFVSNEETIAIVSKLHPRTSPQEAAETLIKTAVERWIDDDGVIDDISAAVVYLEVGEPASNIPIDPILVETPSDMSVSRSNAATPSRSSFNSMPRTPPLHGRTDGHARDQDTSSEVPCLTLKSSSRSEHSCVGARDHQLDCSSSSTSESDGPPSPRHHPVTCISEGVRVQRLSNSFYDPLD